MNVSAAFWADQLSRGQLVIKLMIHIYYYDNKHEVWHLSVLFPSTDDLQGELNRTPSNNITGKESLQDE